LVDTVGSIETVEALLPAMRRQGHIVSAGFYGTQDRLALQPLRLGELSVDMVSGWSQRRMDETRALIHAGHLQTLPLITHHFAADQVEAAWDLIRSKSDRVLGVILDW
jgi:3-hydroxyethyl bacteriochlorophyllide a dehydrogenase